MSRSEAETETEEEEKQSERDEIRERAPELKLRDLRPEKDPMGAGGNDSA